MKPPTKKLENSIKTLCKTCTRKEHDKTFHLDFENQTFDLSYKSMEEASDSIPV